MHGVKSLKTAGPQFVCMLWVRSAHGNKNAIPPSEGRPSAKYKICQVLHK